jgi:integrase
MKFITDKEQVKAGLIIFRRGDVGHDQYNSLAARLGGP